MIEVTVANITWLMVDVIAAIRIECVALDTNTHANMYKDTKTKLLCAQGMMLHHWHFLNPGTRLFTRY